MKKLLCLLSAAPAEVAVRSYNINVNEMFMWKWQAEFYAWRARRAGYVATVVYEGSNWIELGGCWSVRLENKETK